MKVTRAIEASGFGISGDIGGIQKNTYYTPDGRTIVAVPLIREFKVEDKNGKILRSGTRDANLDHGWLLTKPTVILPHCNGCGRWHETQKEVTECIKNQKSIMDKWERIAHKELKKEKIEKDVKIENLSKELSDLKEMVRKLTEARK
jgi:hypothetical protein